MSAVPFTLHQDAVSPREKIIVVFTPISVDYSQSVQLISCWNSHCFTGATWYEGEMDFL